MRWRCSLLTNWHHDEFENTNHIIIINIEECENSNKSFAHLLLIIINAIMTFRNYAHT